MKCLQAQDDNTRQMLPEVHLEGWHAIACCDIAGTHHSTSMGNYKAAVLAARFPELMASSCPCGSLTFC